MIRYTRLVVAYAVALRLPHSIYAVCYSWFVDHTRTVLIHRSARTRLTCVTPRRVCLHTVAFGWITTHVVDVTR